MGDREDGMTGEGWLDDPDWESRKNFLGMSVCGVANRLFYVKTPFVHPI